MKKEIITFFNQAQAPIQNVAITTKNPKNVQLDVLREDQLHPVVSGNKYRKLKYNLLQVVENNYAGILTYGGAYSNHIAAVAAAGHHFQIPSVGIIRGEELYTDEKIAGNETLAFAKAKNMNFKFVSRSVYQKKEHSDEIQEILQEFSDYYVLPEGGTNELAVQGCAEILDQRTADYDIVCCPVGTGGTLAGICQSAHEKQLIMGYSALKGLDVRKLIAPYTNRKIQVVQEDVFGGYGKIDERLIAFCNAFAKAQQIHLDPVYTGKMLYRLYEAIENGTFASHTRILAIHTGGLQGLAGMNQRIKNKYDNHFNYA